MKEQTLQQRNNEPLSPELYRALYPQDLRERPDTMDPQRFLSGNILATGEIKACPPLERMLTIVEKHWNEALDRDVDYDKLTAFGRDDNCYVIPGTSTPAYQTFTREMLSTPNFPYTPDEASHIGNYLGELTYQEKAEFVIDRILLRKALEGVKSYEMKEKIWYALTLHGSDVDVLKHLRKSHSGEENTIIHEMKTQVLPYYEKFLENLREYTTQDVGIGYNGNIAILRKRFIRQITDRFDYDSRNARPMVKETA